jgi:putative membrane protein
MPPTITPRIETETAYAPRLELTTPDLPVLQELAEPADPRWSMPILVLAGATTLVLGLAALQTGNFVAAEFARSRILGGITLAIALTGFALIALGLWRESRALASLQSVDRLRRDLASPDPHARTEAARTWLSRLPNGKNLRPALDALNDPDAIVPLLRAGLETDITTRAEALARRAAFQVVAGMAAAPAPALVVLLVSWRGLRLIRQTAALYGLRPGLFGTLGLLRRTAIAAGATAVTEAAVNTATHAILSTPLLTHLAGEMAGGAVAARRMVVLGRAASVACSPLPPP